MRRDLGLEGVIREVAIEGKRGAFGLQVEVRHRLHSSNEALLQRRG